MNTKTEQVLCIPRTNLPENWVKKKTRLKMDLDHFITQCTQSGYQFVDRPIAEKNNTLKQIIPYIILQTKDFTKTAVYSRKGSEQRLHDLWSVGIGGHINPIDRSPGKADFKQILITGLNRELEEELIKRKESDTPEFIGIISEDLTEVGSVHLGAVFRIFTSEPDAYFPGAELFDFKWEKTKNLKNLTLELWSELALSLLNV